MNGENNNKSISQKLRLCRPTKNDILKRYYARILFEYSRMLKRFFLKLLTKACSKTFSFCWKKSESFKPAISQTTSEQLHLSLRDNADFDDIK